MVGGSAEHGPRIGIATLKRGRLAVGGAKLTLRHFTPLDPSFYPDFQYRSKGLIQDFFGKKKEQAQLNDLLNNVLRKYAELKQPYFTNFIHTTREANAVLDLIGRL